MSEQRVLFLRKGFIGTCAFAALVLLASFYSIVNGAVDRAAKQRLAGDRRSQLRHGRSTPRRAARAAARTRCSPASATDLSSGPAAVAGRGAALIIAAGHGPGSASARGRSR